MHRLDDERLPPAVRTIASQTPATAGPIVAYVLTSRGNAGAPHPTNTLSPDVCRPYLECLRTLQLQPLNLSAHHA